MANTYSQIHIMLVWTVQYRHGLIQKEWKEELYKYITAIVQNRDNKVLRINGMPDYVHLFFGMRTKECPAKLMQEVKENSTKWINRQALCKGKFAWQDGFGAFSYGHSQINDVVRYIINQEEHHRKKTFLEEYRQLLDLFQVAYNEQFLFHEPR